MARKDTYKQIAGAVWKNPILRKHVQQLYLEEVDRKCTAMCSLKNPSCLRSPSKKDLQNLACEQKLLCGPSQTNLERLAFSSQRLSNLYFFFLNHEID